jgi:hypothetical protein
MHACLLLLWLRVPYVSVRRVGIWQALEIMLRYLTSQGFSFLFLSLIKLCISRACAETSGKCQGHSGLKEAERVPSSSSVRFPEKCERRIALLAYNGTPARTRSASVNHVLCAAVSSRMVMSQLLEAFPS